MSDGPRKIAMSIPITRQMALDYGLVEPTPMERAEMEAASERSRIYARRVKEADALMLQRLRLKGDATVNAMLELHKPDRAGSRRPDCEGDDFSGYEGEAPEWPCRTVLALANLHGIPTREAVIW